MARTRCPNCGKSGRVSDRYLGLPVRCPACQTKFIARDATISGEFPIAEPYFPPVAAEDDGPMAPRAGRDIPELIGRFQIRTWLGRGGFGDVYLAHDPVLEREVALKVPKTQMLSNPERVARFLREAKAAARLQHPHIVPVFDSGQDGDHYYIASAYIEGHSLDHALMEKRLDPVRAAALVRALAEALAYAHSQGIVHRDIKPANIMLDAKGAPYVVDFGLATRMGDPADSDHASDDAGVNGESDPKMTQLATAQVTIKRVRMGTPSYWSPEQAAGILENVKAPTDQYSLGMVFYELLCGHPAFSGPPILLQAHAQKTPPQAPRTLKPELSEDLEAICLKTLSKQPEDRYPSCQELADDLRRWLEGEQTQARPWPMRERVARWYKREPLRAWSLGMAGIALMAALVLSILFGVQQSRDAHRIGTALELAQKSQQQAEESERNTKITLSGAANDRGQMLGEQQEPGIGVHWLVESLEIAIKANALDLQHAVRLNLSAWSRSMHALRQVAAMDAKVQSVLFHPDGSKLYLGGENYVSQGSTTELFVDRMKLGSLKAGARALALTGDDKLLIASDTKILRLDPLHFEKGGQEILHANASITMLAVAPRKGLPEDPEWIAYVDVNKHAWLRNPSDAEQPLRIDKDGNVLCLAFTACGQAIVMGCEDGTARFWSLQTKSEDRRINGKDEVRALAVHPDGKRLLLARSKESTGSGQAELWSVAEKQLLKVFEHQAEVHTVAISPCGTVLVSAGRDRSAHLWRADSPYQQVGRTLWHPAEITYAVFHPIKQGLVTVDSDHTVRLWEARQQNLNLAFPGKSASYTTAVAAQADGKIFLAPLGASQVIDAEGLKFGVEFEPAKITAFQLKKGPDCLITAAEVTNKDNAKVEHLVQWRSGLNKLTLSTGLGDPHTDWVFRVAISPQGDTVASVGFDGNFYVWNPDKPNEPILQKHHPREKLFALAYHPNPNLHKVVIGGTDRHARIYDLNNPNEIPVTLKHPNSVLSAAYSPNGRYLLIGFAGGAQLWDLTSEKKEYPLQHLTGAFAVAFSPGGKMMVTAGSDRQARLWDVATRKQIGPPLLHPGQVFAATLTKEALITATRPLETTVHRWLLPRASDDDLDELRRQAKLLSNIKLGMHNTAQALDGKEWIKLQKANTKTKVEDWRKTWEDWPKDRHDLAEYKLLKPTNEPKAKMEPAKEPDAKNAAIKWFDFKVPANVSNLPPVRFFPDDVGVTMQVHLDRIHASTWAKAHQETLDSVHAKVKAFMPAEAGGVANLAKDVERISVAAGEDLETGIVVLEGRFQKLYAVATLLRAVNADSVPVVGLEGGFHAALVSDKMMVAARDWESLQSALRRAPDAKRTPLHREFAELLKKADVGADLHFMATSAWLDKKFGELKLPVNTISGTVKLKEKTAYLKVIGKEAEDGIAADLVKSVAFMMMNPKDLVRLFPKLQPLADASGTFKDASDQGFVIFEMQLPNEGLDKLVNSLLSP